MSAGQSSSRPASSASVRPSTSASLRSLVNPRPASSIGISRKTPTSASRPSSRATQRPSSRVAHRPPTRQSARLASLYQELVIHLTGLTPENNSDDFDTAVDLVSRSVDPTLKPGASVDLLTVQQHLRGLAHKARINSHDTLATALNHTQRELRKLAETESDLDAEIHMSRLPGHVQFLLALGQPPDRATLDHAEAYVYRVNNPDKPPPGLSWAEILAEEPFTGQHWEGARGLPPGSVANNHVEDDARSDESGLSLSLLEDDYGSLDSPSRSSSIDPTGSDDGAAILTPPTDEKEVEAYMQKWTKEIEAYRYRTEVESLQARQYWRSEWRMDAQTLNQRFNIGNAASLGPALNTIRDPAGLVQYRCINEHDAVREVLMALQGRKNIMLVWNGTGEHALCFTPDPKAPSLLHLTPSALKSILSSFAQVSTAAEHLRKFAAAMYASAAKSYDPGASTPGNNGPLSLRTNNRRTTRTLEAFAEAVDMRVRQFDAWCAEEEEQLCRAQAGAGPPRICSLLSLRSRIEHEFSDALDVLLDLVRALAQRATRSPEPVAAVWTLPDLPKRMSPAAVSAFLLNSLLSEVQRASSMGNETTMRFLLAVFRDAAAPAWGMVHRWLKEGMPVREAGTQQLDEEFFIEDNELVLLDPDFWTECFVLREGLGEEATSACVPDFLAYIAPHVLAAGKAVGLLRVLGVPGSYEQAWLQGWQPLDMLLRDESSNGIHSLVDFPKFVYDTLHPVCRQAEQMLSQLLIDECDVWTHLTAMEGLYLMRRGDIMSTFLDVLFVRMDGPLPWTDFHFLNTAFADVASNLTWLDPALVRFSYAHSAHRDVSPTRALDGLQVEYAVPFPLTYIWGPAALQEYSALFVFVLQMRRAKRALEQILVRGKRTGAEMKMFYAMRGKLSWFVNVLLNFVCTNVLHTQVLAFHKAFHDAKSLDEMIQSHNDHLQTLQGLCLLHPNTTAIHQAITSILDMTLQFSASFASFAGTSAARDTSKHIVTPLKSHRSRRLRGLRKNVIGFARTLPGSDSGTSSESESDADAETDYSSAHAPSFSSFGEDDVVVRLDTMSAELDSLVRFVRRGVESLAAGTTQDASTFEMFAFALEDWDQ